MSAAVALREEDADWRPDVPYKLVAVEWVDSAQPISAWQWADDYEMPKIVVCISVGYLIAETDEAIALAPNLGDVGRERVQASGVIRLPRAAVRKISPL